MFPRLLLAFLVVCIGINAAAAQKRVALLIGNAAYNESVGKLENPHNDIELVGNALKAVGFEVMSPIKDATRSDILIAVDDFAKKLNSAGEGAVGFFYYSGHGIAVGGENFLVPIDARSTSSRRMRVSGVRQEDVVKILRNTAPQAAHYIVLDACRNNIGGARGGKGFVPVNKEAGVLYAFATKPGQTATDEGRGGGPYAKALARELVRPDVPDLMMFHAVRTSVIESTGGDQVPWLEDGIQRPDREYFGGKSDRKVTPRRAAPQPQLRPQPKQPDAASAWNIIDKSDDCQMVATFRRRYKGSIWADFAETREKKLGCGRHARLTEEPPEKIEPDKPKSPQGLPPKLSEACERGLEKWRKRASIGVFAVAENGACGWNWGSKTLAQSRKGAMRECSKRGKGCRVFATHETNKGDWTLSGECQKAKESWHERASKGAFAVSQEGACGWNWGSRTLEIARRNALSACRKNGEACKIIATHAGNAGDWTPGSECRKSLAKWRNRASQGAFAVARNGACGWNWASKTLAAAERGALNQCKKHGSECKVIETHTTNKGDWELGNNCKRDLKAWRKKPGNGAFAVARNGSCGWAYSNDSLDGARTTAMQYCGKHGSECRVIETSSR